MLSTFLWAGSTDRMSEKVGSLLVGEHNRLLEAGLIPRTGSPELMAHALHIPP